MNTESKLLKSITDTINGAHHFSAFLQEGSKAGGDHLQGFFTQKREEETIVPTPTKREATLAQVMKGLEDQKKAASIQASIINTKQESLSAERTFKSGEFDSVDAASLVLSMRKKEQL